MIDVKMQAFVHSVSTACTVRDLFAHLEPVGGPVAHCRGDDHDGQHILHTQNEARTRRRTSEWEKPSVNTRKVLVVNREVLLAAETIH